MKNKISLRINQVKGRAALIRSNSLGEQKIGFTWDLDLPGAVDTLVMVVPLSNVRTCRRSIFKCIITWSSDNGSGSSRLRVVDRLPLNLSLLGSGNNGGAGNGLPFVLGDCASRADWANYAGVSQKSDEEST